MKKSLIIIPYAYGGNTGANLRNTRKQLETYLKNVLVAASSAISNAGKTADVMVVSNIEIPEPYKTLLNQYTVKYELCPFDQFNFGEKTPDGQKVNWQLAFYKLCALSHCVEKFDYLNYCFLDADVFIQNSFESIWKDSINNILLLDLCVSVEGTMVKEMGEYLRNGCQYNHFGGEFYAASAALTRKFISECKKVFDEMKATGYITKHGDEFITSIAAHRLKPYVKNAKAYIRRYWTGSYRQVCNDYKKDIVILHLPAEKEQGIIAIYNRYVSKGIVPSNKKAWDMLHLTHSSLRVKIGVALRRMGIVK